MPTFTNVVEGIGLVIDAAGVFAIVLGLLFATLRYATGGRQATDGYRRYRQDLGRGILLGLELLVAADIIRQTANRVVGGMGNLLPTAGRVLDQKLFLLGRLLAQAH
jgi:uncharacterized membrane protein